VGFPHLASNQSKSHFWTQNVDFPTSPDLESIGARMNNQNQNNHNKNHSNQNNIINSKNGPLNIVVVVQNWESLLGIVL
jgi:hypothetical protein